MSSTPQEQGIIFEQKKQEKRRILIMAALLGICCALTYYFHVVFGVGTVFTHFFYVPIVLACLWWGRKGLVVAVFLALMLILSHFFIRAEVETVNDLIRAPLFIVVALAVTVLSERIAEAEVKLKDYAKELEKVVEERDYARHLIESSPDFQMTLDKGGRIMDVNEAFEHIVGKRREDIIGMSVYQYLPKDATEKAIAAIFAKEKVRDIELIADIPGKGTIICNFSGTVFTTPEGESGIYATGRVITECKKAEEVLNELHRYTRELIEVSLDPLVVISAEGKITDVSHATESVTGYPREKLIGTLFSDYFTDPQKARQGYQQVFREGYVHDYPLEIKHRDGKVTPVLYNASVYHDAQGGVAGVFAAARDITERKKVEEEQEALIKDLEKTNRKLAEKAKELEDLRRATLNMAEDIEKAKGEIEETNIKLERSNRELQDFTYIASHDLREPMRKISAFGQLLQDSLKGKLDEDEEENFAFMIDGANRMQQMIDALLSYSRVTTLAKPAKRVDLNKAIEAIKSVELAVLLEETCGTIHVPEPLPAVSADPSQVHQLLQNLIGNGLKFHREEIAPEITVRSRRVNDNMVQVEVEDNGIGIEEANYEKIFGMFQRLHSRDDYGGTGIGLAVCKKVVERHGGTIGVNSAPGKGSTFWFTMPTITNDELRITNDKLGGEKNYK